MAQRGRPPITEDVLQARIADYCARYGVVRNADGLPPFPAGRRETRQHREWVTLLKARTRLRRRTGGLCRRCDNPAVPGRVFCDEHERSSAPSTAPDDSKARCFVCGASVAGTAVLEFRDDSRATPALVHRACGDVIALAQRVGPELLERVREHLWPERRPRRRPARR